MRRLTYGGNNRHPVWSSDGQRIAFQSDRDGDIAVFWQRADNTGQVERLTKPDQSVAHVPESWHPTSNILLFSAVKSGEFSLWALTLPDKKATAFGGVKSSLPTGAVFSPDGRWVAYTSNETGANRAYVQPFPATGARYQLYGKEQESAHHLLWSKTNELIYNPRPTSLEVVSVTTRPIPSFGNPVPLPRPFSTGPPQTRRPFDLMPDGRFLGLAVPGQTETATGPAPEVRLVLNWFEELKQRVPIK